MCDGRLWLLKILNFFFFATFSSKSKNNNDKQNLGDKLYKYLNLNLNHYRH